MDELLSRQTPHSVEAEQAVIGAALFRSEEHTSELQSQR